MVSPQLKQDAARLMLGTARAGSVAAPGISTPPPADSNPLAALLTGAAQGEASVERVALRRAAILATCQRAGYLPPAPGPTLPLGAHPAPPEAPWAPTICGLQAGVLSKLLTEILGEGPLPIQREALERLARHQGRLPPGLLPLALNLGQREAPLKSLLRPVLGERGHWLAGQKEGWAWATPLALLSPIPGDDGSKGENNGEDAGQALPEAWERGNLDARREYLLAWRATDPAAARDRLATEFARLDARERASLLACLATGLSGEDEAWLETVLTDRSKEVRNQAAHLLSLRPDSAYVARMAARVAACLQRERKLFRSVLELNPPTAFDPAWKADALEEARAKSEPLGQRALWFYQLARALPLDWWERETGQAPDELLAWALKGDWGDALLRAWKDALERETPGHQGAWVRALLANKGALRHFPEPFLLLAKLPEGEAETAWLDALTRAGPGHASRGQVLGRYLASLDPPRPSPAYVRGVLSLLRPYLLTEAAQVDYTLRQSLPDFLCHVPGECLAEAATGWPLDRHEAGHFHEAAARMLRILALRQQLAACLPGA